MPEPADEAAALAWFDAEHRCLLAAQRMASAQRWREAVWDLAWPTETFLRRRGHVQDRHAAWQACIEDVEHLDDPRATILAHRFLGRVEADLGHDDKAVEHLLTVARPGRGPR